MPPTQNAQEGPKVPPRPIQVQNATPRHQRGPYAIHIIVMTETDTRLSNLPSDHLCVSIAVHRFCLQCYDNRDG